MNEEMEKQFVIGLDMGGTNSVFGLVDQRGTVRSQAVIKTKDYPDVNDYVAAGVQALQPALDLIGGIENVRGMGIGAPNGNFYSGNIENAPNLLWKGIVPIAELFEEALGVPTRVTNDANAAALGEMTYGAARGLKNFIEITLGTGVGSGIVVDGTLVYGCDGFAGELGHAIVERSEHARACGCGRHGCLETYCSATGVARTARIMLERTDEPSMLRDLDPENITSFDVYKAAEAGEQVAKDIFDFTGRVLGEACANFALFNAPEAFVFFGGLTKAGHWLMDPLQKAFDENSLFTFKGKAKLIVSTLNGSEAAVLGASALGWE